MSARPTTSTFETAGFRTYPGRGPLHLFCLPGLVPDGPETYLRQMALFRGHGDVTVVTYPYDGFPLDRILDHIAGRIRTAHQQGTPVVLMGLSVGGGLVIELLRRALDAGKPLPLAGLILVSPFTCMDDLAPMLKRFLLPILEPKPGVAPDEALERGRAFFKQLATRSAGDPKITGWWQLLTPQGWVKLQERKIKARIDRTLDGVPIHGGVERVSALMQFRGLKGLVGPLCQAPTMVLWGSRERHTLKMDGPGTGVLSRPDLAYKVLPDLEVQIVYEHDGSEVPHASLLKHAHCFNPHLRRMLARIERRLADGPKSKAAAED